MGEQWHDAFYPLLTQTHPDDYPPPACLGCLVPVAGAGEAVAEPGLSSQGCSMFAEQTAPTFHSLFAQGGFIIPGIVLGSPLHQITWVGDVQVSLCALSSLAPSR